MSENLSIVTPDKIPLGQKVPDNLLEVYKICQKMQVLCEKEGGIGLSAVQVGIPWNLFIVKAEYGSRFSEVDKYSYFLDCSYDVLGHKIPSIEGCLSLRDSYGELRRFQVERAENIHLTGSRLFVKKEIYVEPLDIELSQHQQGIVFQHEIDHQNGILISDTGKEVFLWK